MSPAPTHGVVCSAALDLRTAPEHRAELGSQLLLGEVVRLTGRPRKGWVPVENVADGYRGWVREWGLVPATAPRAPRGTKRANAVVAAPPGPRPPKGGRGRSSRTRSSRRRWPA